MSITFENDIADEDVGNELGLFDDDDPFNLPPPLPPLSPQRDGDLLNQDGDGDQTDKKDDKTEQKKKRRVRRSPRPKLDEVRLCSDRGIPALQHICDGIKFKGKGHEETDLKLLMQRYEHWAHRLFPQFPFVDVVDQVEKLGCKKLVQNCIKRIRRDEQDTVDDEDKSDTEMGQNINGSQGDGTPQSDVTPVTNDQMQTFGVQVEPRDNVVILTPELQERIRQNKERALAKRRAAQERQAEQANTQTDLQNGETEQAVVLSTDNSEIAKDDDNIPENFAMEENPSSQTSDVEMGDESTETTIPLPEGKLQPEKNEGTAISAPIASTNENALGENIEMQNNESEGFAADVDVVQNEDNLSGADNDNLNVDKLDNDLLQANEGVSQQNDNSDVADAHPTESSSSSTDFVESARKEHDDEVQVQEDGNGETLPVPPTVQASDQSKTTDVQSMEIETEQ